MTDLISRQAALDNAWQVMYKDEWHMTQTEQVVSVNDIEALPTIDAVPVGAYEQTRWERDMAIAQLAEIGKSLFEKMDNVATVVRCKDCKYYEAWEKDGDRYCTHFSADPYEYLPTEDDDFCSQGERSEE